jgi:hypothetical protein
MLQKVMIVRVKFRESRANTAILVGLGHTWICERLKKRQRASDSSDQCQTTGSVVEEENQD